RSDHDRPRHRVATGRHRRGNRYVRPHGRL
ncbi:MAG: hypothetical protein AVDCRST_MAG88-985, partial [uncultured Thermomicrobiales bacterium]